MTIKLGVKKVLVGPYIMFVQLLVSEYLLARGNVLISEDNFTEPKLYTDKLSV